MARTVEEIRVGDVGTIFRLTLREGKKAVDLSNMSQAEFIFEKPGGERMERAAVLDTGGLDGRLRYTTVAGDLDRNGNWKLQAHVVLPSGQWHSSIVAFTVHKNL